ERGPRAAERGAHEQELAHFVRATELFDVVQANKPTHGMPKDIDMFNRSLRENRLDLAVNQERRATDVARIERTQVEREDTNAVGIEAAFEGQHRAARAEEAVDEQHRWVLVIHRLEEGAADEPVAARQVADVREGVTAAADILPDDAELPQKTRDTVFHPRARGARASCR